MILEIILLLSLPFVIILSCSQLYLRFAELNTVSQTQADPHRRRMQMSKKGSNVGGQWPEQRSGVGNADQRRRGDVERSGSGINYSAFPCCVQKAVWNGNLQLQR